MLPADAAKRYFTMSLQAASKEQVLLTLYDTAIQEANWATDAIRCRDLEAKTRHLHRVSTILSELINALDHKIAPEFCMHLLELYLYMKRRLTEASTNLEAEAAEEVARLLAGLREAWRQAASAKDPAP
ncbi:MAG: flagellar export chaperone FliS [Thermodesulfobacteriota bacterium]